MSKTKSSLRSLMEKKANGTTGRRVQMTTQYSKLPQNISDDDDEMNIEVHQAENHQNYKQEIVELEMLCPTDSAQDEILIQGQTLSRARSICFALSLFFCVAFTLGFIFVAPCRQLPCDNKHQTNKTSDWEKVFPNHVITSHIILTESDNNHQNILLALISSAVMENISNNNTSKICGNKGISSCNSLLFLLRGDDGREIWQLSFKSIINSINCQQSDVNGNGWKDCIISGSMGLVMALDPRKGIVLWKSESVLLKSTWTAFGPQMLQDFDGDGIVEFVVRVGQNVETTTEKTDNHDRLIMISGKTGAVMPYFLKIPGSGQSYIPPIIYKKPDKSSYILFSSFEESESSASLWIISFPEFYHLVENFPSDYIINKIKGSYKPWPGIVADHLGLLKIYSFHTKGLSVAPIIIDLTQDGIDDVLIEQYGGSLVLLDGVTWKIVWQKQFVGWESFSSPAPGFFNNDSILDIMVRWNFGIWPDYNESMICILDGRTGETLWSLSSGLSDFSSPISFHTALPHRDVFAFAISGRSLPSGTTAQNMFLLNAFNQINKRSTNILEPIENLPEIETHPFLSHIITPEVPHIHEGLTIPELNSQEHFESQSEESQLLSNYSKLMPDESSPFQIVADSRQQQEMGLCNENIVPHVTEVFLLDRSFNKKSLLLTKFNFGQYHYNFSKKIQKKLSVNKELCALYETTGLLTGAVGDVDADGCLDLVAVSVAAATLINEEVHYEVKLKKININTKVTDPKYIEMPAVMKDFAFSEPSLMATSFSSLQTQSWIQFQGVRDDSRYP